MRRRIQVADVVALELESRAAVAARVQDVGNVLERVLEHTGFAAFQVRLFPVELPRFVAWNHVVQAEIHRPHVQGGQLRLKAESGLQPFLYGHRLRSAGRDVDDDVRGGFDSRQKLFEHVRILSRLAANRRPGVEVYDRSASARGVYGALGDVVGGDRQM